MLFRILIYVVIGGAIYFGIRRIINDWRAQFRANDQATRVRDLNERERPDVVELKRDQDGVFRPGDKDERDK
jgi:hypothetical protein